MPIFMAKTFARFARRASLCRASLVEAIDRAERGLIDADLGGGIIKQRVAREGKGRRGGFRTLIAFRCDELAIYLFGFAKNDRDNIEPDELRALQLIAAQWLGDPRKVEKDVGAGILIEVKHDEED